ncbi:MAG: hypothetical protein OEY23_16670 [Acidimicrobiia bacterium]|nr:hypothetical protein [Acidimicrobiia bacterium]MDH5236667.1 hypothetical protein [Acidimicrobiia bacterium]
MTTPPSSAHRAFARFAACLLPVAVLAAACGDDSDSSGGNTVSLAEWVDQFDRACIAATHALSNTASSMSDAELAAFNEGAFTTLAALKPPADKADIAAGLVDDLRNSLQPGLDEDQIAALDQQVLQAMTELGVSEECTGGAPG